jgi:ectoine hydroxylase-related dioxygenase (phytanoyl-CoA dioxygenase family)
MSQAFTLSHQQREQFDQTGVLRLPRLLSPQFMERAQFAVRRKLAATGLWSDGAWRLDAIPRPVWPDNGWKSPSKTLNDRRGDVAALLEDSNLQAAVNQLLLERPFDRAAVSPHILFTLPNAEKWFVPPVWHSDAPRLASGACPGVQTFIFLDTVVARGGGTAILAGSHRLLNDGRTIRPKNLVGNLIQQHAFFRQLFGKETLYSAPDDPLPRAVIEDVELQVMELTGLAGDVWFIDLRVLHATAPNASDRPRLMITSRFFRSDLKQEMDEAWRSTRRTSPHDPRLRGA